MARIVITTDEPLRIGLKARIDDPTLDGWAETGAYWLQDRAQTVEAPVSTQRTLLRIEAPRPNGRRRVTVYTRAP